MRQALGANEPTVVVGLGNDIGGDDAVGVLAARRLTGLLAARSDVRVIELPWAGLELLEAVRGHERAILIDSLRGGRYRPGTVVRVSEDDLGGSVRLNSFHDLSYPTALALGRVLGWPLPDEIAIYAIEGESFDRFGTTLTPAVAEALDRVVDQVMGCLDAAECRVGQPGTGDIPMIARTAPNGRIPDPGVFHRPEQDLREAFLSQVERIPGGERIQRCIQCGTCSGSCPLSYAMDLTPREVIARFRAGALDGLLRSRTIWLCASCYQCSTRCPANIKVTDLLYALKRVGVDQRLFPRRFPLYALSESFVKQVKRYGRNHELGLLRTYFTRTGILQMLKRAGLGWSLWRRGRLGLRPERIRGIEGLRKMIAHAETFKRPQEPADEPKLTRQVGYEAIG